MARRVLSQEEIAARKLTPAAPSRKVLTADEVQARGLSPATPEPPPQKEPPQVGPGATFALRGAGALPAGGLVTDVLATAALRDATQAGKKFPGLSRAIAGLVGRLPGGQYLPAPVADAGAVLTPQAQAELYKLGLTEEEVKDPGIPERGLVDTYREVRDTRKEKTEAGSEQNPWWGRAGAATGILASILAPLPSVKIGPLAPALLGARGSKVAGGIASGAATGGAYGALSGATEGDADLSRGDVSGFARDIVDRALGGAAIGGLAAGAAEAVSPLWRAIRAGALDQGRKVLQGGSDIAAKTRKALSDDAVEEVIVSGGIKPLSTTQATHQRVSDLAEESGQLYGEIVAQLEARGVRGADVKKMADELMERAIQERAVNLTSDAVPNTFKRVARRTLEEGKGQRQLGLTQTEGIKQNLQREGRLDMLNRKPTDEAKGEIASRFRQGSEDAIEAASASAPANSELRSLGNAFVPVKQRTGRLLEARGFTEKAASAANQRGNVSLKDYMIGGAAGDPVTALATALVSGLARNRVPSALASGGYAMSEALRTGTASPALAQMVTLATDPEVTDIATALSELLRRKKPQPPKDTP